VPAFGKLRIRQITRSAIERYLAELDAKVVPKGEKREGERLLWRKTINGSLIPLRGVLDRAVQDGIIPSNLPEAAESNSTTRRQRCDTSHATM
jgi:hypothetical protein